MRKYIKPQIEAQEVALLFAICDPSAGSGQGSNPVPGGGSNSAPRKVF